MSERESQYGIAPFKPQIDMNLLFNHSWYLHNIDEKFRRSYKKKSEVAVNGHV